MIRVWRVCARQWAGEMFTGRGAHLAGGRWNSPGRPVIYASHSLSLCLLENLANLQDLGFLERGFVRAWLDLPRDAVQRLETGPLPPDWTRPEHPVPRRLGDDWLARSASLALAVPSAIVPLEDNFLVNPLHPDFARAVQGPAEDLPVTPRLLLRGAEGS